MNIIKFITKFTLGGQMSEQGADAAGMELYKGFKFFLKACGIGAAFTLFFWQSPEFLKALAEFILTLKNS